MSRHPYFMARHPGTCRKCGNRFDAGETIVEDTSDGWHGYRHYQCREQAQQELPLAE